MTDSTNPHAEFQRQNAPPLDPRDDPFRIDPHEIDGPAHILSPEEMAQKLKPLRVLNGIKDRPGLTHKTDGTAITAGRVMDGLNKLIMRLNEVRGMSDTVRESLTREVPKDVDPTSGAPVQADGPIFETLARLTLDLSREIERVEKNMALSLAVLK
jgi:hypothetical protein